MSSLDPGIKNLRLTALTPPITKLYITIASIWLICSEPNVILKPLVGMTIVMAAFFSIYIFAIAFANKDEAGPELKPAYQTLTNFCLKMVLLGMVPFLNIIAFFWYEVRVFRVLTHTCRSPGLTYIRFFISLCWAVVSMIMSIAAYSPYR